jgi:hypothetical protein
MARSAALFYAASMPRRLIRFVLVAAAITVAIALAIHLFAPDAMRSLGRALHGG